jgi:hypothetical protein
MHLFSFSFRVECLMGSKPKVAEELSALNVKRLPHPGGKRNLLFSVGGVLGLYMHLIPKGERSWVLRVKVGTLRRDIGLGVLSDKCELVSVCPPRYCVRPQSAVPRDQSGGPCGPWFFAV